MKKNAVKKATSISRVNDTIKYVRDWSELTKSIKQNKKMQNIKGPYIK